MPKNLELGVERDLSGFLCLLSVNFLNKSAIISTSNPSPPSTLNRLPYSDVAANLAVWFRVAKFKLYQLLIEEGFAGFSFMEDSRDCMGSRVRSQLQHQLCFRDCVACVIKPQYQFGVRDYTTSYQTAIWFHWGLCDI